MGKAGKKRDRQITQAIHRLYWQANFVDTPAFIVWLMTRPTANLLYDVFMPIQIAYGLQAIVTRQFEAVSGYVWTLLLLALGYCILWAIGGAAVIRGAKHAAIYLQKAVFTNFLQKDYEF